MWIAKPVYESLPYFYLSAGVVSLLGGMYVNYGLWPFVCFATGFGCIAGGLAVLLKRRDARRNKRPVRHEQ